MTAQAWLQIAFFARADGARAVARRLHGARLPGRARVADACWGRSSASPTARCGDPDREQTWKGYARTTIVFSALFWLVLYVILRTQGIHPFNRRGSTRALGRHLQHDVLVHHQHELAVLRRRDDDVVFLADGRAGRAELRLGSGRHGGDGGGDPRLCAPQRPHARQLLGRSDADTALHPAAAVVHRRAAACLAGRRSDAFRPGLLHDRDRGEQTLALGPAASQIAIKQLGSNGGGFFNVNSAMPFENATQLTNFIEVLFILLIPASLNSRSGAWSAAGARAGRSTRRCSRCS